MLSRDPGKKSYPADVSPYIEISNQDHEKDKIYFFGLSHDNYFARMKRILNLPLMVHRFKIIVVVIL